MAVFKDPESGFEPQNERILGLGRVQYSVRRLLADPANSAFKFDLLGPPEQMLHGRTHGRDGYVLDPGIESTKSRFQIRPLRCSFLRN